MRPAKRERDNDDEDVIEAIDLARRIPENILAIGVKSHGPQSDTGHDLLSTLEFAITTEDALDELASAVLAHGHLLGVFVAFGILEHELFADF